MAENYKAALAAQYRALCYMPAASRPAEIAKITEWIRLMANGFNQAAVACENGTTEEWRSWRDWIQKQLPKNMLVKSDAGVLVNTRPLFVTGETLFLNATLAKCGTATPITTVTKDRKRYLPEAAGAASVQEAQVEAASTVITIAAVVKDSDSNATVSYTYCIPEGTQAQFNTRGGSIAAAVSGSVGISDLAGNSQGQRTGFPTGIDLTFSCTGGKVQMTLDPTRTENSIVLDAAGSGSLNAAVIVSGSLPTDEFDLSHYQTIWINLPVALSSDGQSLVIGAPQPMSGLAFVPVDPQVAWAMSYTAGSTQNPLPPWSEDPCADLDGDGQLDSIEREAHSINCQMKAGGCSSAQDTEGCL
jgi:hypothetical protein